MTLPVVVILTLAGLRSRWTMPLACAAASASAIWPAIRSASRDRQRSARDPLGQGLAVDEFQHQAADAVRFLESVDGADVRVIEGGQRARLAA